MDLREKFVIDLFEIINDKDKGNTKFEDMSREDQDRARGLAEGMIKKGWFFEPQKGKK